MNKMPQGQPTEQINLTFQQTQKCDRGSNRVSIVMLGSHSNDLVVPITHFFEGLLPKGNVATETVVASLSADDWKIAALVTGISRRNLRRRLMTIAREIAGIDADSLWRPKNGATPAIVRPIFLQTCLWSSVARRPS